MGLRVYVAGKYNAGNVVDCLNNIRIGNRVGTEVLLAGMTPFVPFQDFMFQLMLQGNESLTIDHYYQYSIDWLKQSQAMFVMPDYENSKGTLKEIEIARELDIKIVYSMEELLEYKKYREEFDCCHIDCDGLADYQTLDYDTSYLCTLHAVDEDEELGKI